MHATKAHRVRQAEKRADFRSLAELYRRETTARVREWRLFRQLFARDTSRVAGGPTDDDDVDVRTFDLAVRTSAALQTQRSDALAKRVPGAFAKKSRVRIYGAPGVGKTSWPASSGSDGSGPPSRTDGA